MTNNDNTLNESDLRQIDETIPEAVQDEMQPQELAKATDTVKRPVIYYPAKVLNKRCKTVDNPTDPSIMQLIMDLKETMIVGGGLGISAPQVGDTIRLFITRLDPMKSDDSLDQDVKVYINPTVTLTGKNKMKSERCLSFPGILIKTKRSTRVTVTATDAYGIEFTAELEGLEAHVVQHEANHLDGITLYTRMDDTQKIKARKGLKLLNQLSRYHAKATERARTADAEETADPEAAGSTQVINEVAAVVDLVDLY